MPSANTVAELAVVVSADTSQVDSGLSGLNSKLTSVGGAMATAFTGAAVAGIAAVAGGLVASVSAAADFEKTMSGVKAVSGATADEMENLSGLALQLGKDTSFSASEAAAGIEELVKGGLSIPDIMNGAAKATLDLAAAGGVSLPEAATIAANALAQFNLQGEDMGHVADLIAGAANASALDVGDFSFSLKAAGAVASTVGFNFDDLAQAIAVMGKAGITGSDAGTSLKTMMLNLQPSTKKQTELMRELGLITEDGANQFFDATGKVKSMANVAGVLQTALAGMSEQQRIAALETLFGSDAIRAGAVLAKEGAAGFNEMAASMSKVTAASVGAERLNNLAGAWEQLKGSLETAAITIGMSLLPVLTDLVKWATEGVNALIPALDGMGKAFADVVTMMTGSAEQSEAASKRIEAAISAALGPEVAASVTQTLKDLKETVEMATAAMAGSFETHGAEIQAGQATFWTSTILTSSERMRELLAGVRLALQLANQDWKGAWQTLSQIQDAEQKIQIAQSEQNGALAAAAIDTVTAGMLTRAQENWTQMTQIVTDAWNGAAGIVAVVTTAAGSVLTEVTAAWTQVSAVTDTIFKAVQNVIIAIWTAIFESTIKPKLDAIRDYVGGTWDTIKTYAEQILNAVAAFISSVWTSVFETTIKPQLDAIRDYIGAAWNTIKTTTETILNGVLAFVRDTIMGPMRQSVETSMSGPSGAAGLFETAVNAIKETVTSTMTEVQKAWERVWGAIQAAAESPQAAMREIIKLCKDLNAAMPDWLIPHSPTPLQIGLEGISQAAKDATKRMASFFDESKKGAADPNADHGEVASYIRAAAEARGIDPATAIKIAQSEGGLVPNTTGKFKTGWSFWPFQLHYGGKGYEFFGDTAGMGNDFTRSTGWSPGDERAWKDSVDYALDHAAKSGWGAWYGRGPAGVGAWEGIPGHAEGGIAWKPHLAWVGEKEPEAIIPRSWFGAGGGGGGGVEHVVVDIAIGGRVAEQIYVTGREIAVRRGRAS